MHTIGLAHEELLMELGKERGGNEIYFGTSACFSKDLMYEFYPLSLWGKSSIPHLGLFSTPRRWYVCALDQVMI